MKNKKCMTNLKNYQNLICISVTTLYYGNKVNGVGKRKQNVIFNIDKKTWTIKKKKTKLEEKKYKPQS